MIRILSAAFVFICLTILYVPYPGRTARPIQGRLIVTSALTGKVLSTMYPIDDTLALGYVECLVQGWGIELDDVKYYID